MSIKLFIEALLKYLLGILLVGALIFVPAGTIYFINGWILMGVLFIPMFIAGIVMMVKNPKLLASRLDAKEKQKGQGIIIKLSGLMFVIGFIVAGLDYRFNLLRINKIYTYIFAVVLLLSYLMWAEVLRENTYLSRTIRVEENQKVVDTGLYGIVRHPMYSATIILFLSMPIVLGSFASFLIFLVYPILIIFRIKNEEKLLENELEGYIEYKKRVKYRIIPFIW